MKLQLQVAQVAEKIMTLLPKWLLIGVVALLCLGVAIPSVAQTDSAQLRVGHFVLDAPAVNLYVDGTAVTGSDSHASVFGSMTLPDQYLDFSAGAHTFAVVPDGGTLEFAIISAHEFTMEASHHYLLAMLGNAFAKDLHFTLLDETAALAQTDISKGAVSVIINNINGIPAIDGYFGGKSLFNNLAYGDYFVSQDPTEGQGTQITVHNDAASMVFEFPDATPSPKNVFAVFVFSGKYPGTIWEDYTALYAPQYAGTLTIADGGAIAVGDSLPVTIPDAGQRVQYTLTLDRATTLDIVQSAKDATLGLDSFARIYNSAGDMLYENDEVSVDDNAQGIFDAGWKGLALDAGTYTLETGTFVDSGKGAFTLSVLPSP